MATRPLPKAHENNWHYYSAECSPGGDGQCDGYIYGDTHWSNVEFDGLECSCGCHSDWAGLPNSVAGVSEWHDDYHDLKVEMSWGIANRLHQEIGHDKFVAAANAENKVQVFIDNVCTNQRCSNI